MLGSSARSSSLEMRAFTTVEARLMSPAIHQLLRRVKPILPPCSGENGGLQEVARRVGEEADDALEIDAVRHEPLPGIGAAREERERGTHGSRRVVEGADEAEL